MRHPYYDSFSLLERLHRNFLEVIKTELDRQQIQDINNIQALILYNIGHDEMTVGELMVRGCYLGSNISYNVKKMTEADYLTQERSLHDKRSVRVKLSTKGLTLHEKISTQLEKQIALLDKAQISENELSTLNTSLHKLERFWSGMVAFANIN